MENTMRFGELDIVPIVTDRAIDFQIMRGNQYLFRLTACMEGFELSPLDKSLGVEVEDNLVEQIGAFILNQDNNV